MNAAGHVAFMSLANTCRFVFGRPRGIGIVARDVLRNRIKVCQRSPQPSKLHTCRKVGGADIGRLARAVEAREIVFRHLVLQLVDDCGEPRRIAPCQCEQRRPVHSHILVHYPVAFGSGAYP